MGCRTRYAEPAGPLGSEWLLAPDKARWRAHLMLLTQSSAADGAAPRQRRQTQANQEVLQ